MPGPPRAPRFRLTYTSASTRASSDLPQPPSLPKPRRLRLRPHQSPPPPSPPLPQRSVTTLGDTPDLSRAQLYHQRALSASALSATHTAPQPPPPHAEAHISRPQPPPAAPARYPARHPHSLPAHPPQRPASRGVSLPNAFDVDAAPPSPRDDAPQPLRRTRSAHKQKSAFPYSRNGRTRVPRGVHRQPSSNSVVQPHRERDRTPLRTASGPRAVYNATTASAKAAALSSSRARVGYLVQPRDRHAATRTHEEESTDLSSIHLSSRDDSSYNLAADRARRLEAAKFHKSNVDPNAECASKRATRIVVKHRVIRGSSSWRPATEDDIDEYLHTERHREMVRCVAADINVMPQPPPVVAEEQVADNLCSNCANPPSSKKLTPRRGVRRVSSLLSRHLGLDADHTLDVAEMATMDEYKAVAIFLAEIRKCRKEMYYGLRDKSMERSSERQSSSAKKKDTRKGSKEKKYAKDLEKFHRAMTEQRSMSADDPAIMRALMRQDQLHALVAATRKKAAQRPADPLKNEAVIAMQGNPKYDKERSQSELDLRQKMFHPEARTRVASCLAGGGRFDSLISKEKTTSEVAEVNGECERFDDDEEYSNSPLRILTAMEPVDPSIGFEDSDAQRGTSYHMEFSTHGVAGSRRRAPHRNSGDYSILRRFRSLRRRAEDRY